MNSGNRLENFRPQSPPISLLSYNAISTGAVPLKPTCIAAPPKQNSSVPAETIQPTQETTSKSILKNSIALPPPQPKPKSRPPSRPTTPTNTAKNFKQKTVAFGLTTNVSDTVEKNKNTPLLKNAVQRISRPLMASTREVEEIHKQLRSQKEEMEVLKRENTELKKSVDDLRADEAKLSRALTSISSRLMELEKQRHSQSLNASISSQQQQPVLATVPVMQKLSLQEKKQQRQAHSSESSRLQQISPVEQPEKQAARRDVSYPSAPDDKKMNDFLSFIKRRIRENPEFEQKINRTVMLFGGGPDVNSVPSTMSDRQRVPMRMDPTNEANPSSYYGAKYTQCLTLHKEITTFSPDRGHLARIPPSTRHSNDENFFVDEESDHEVMGYQQHEPGANMRRQAQNSSVARRDRYRKN